MRLDCVYMQRLHRARANLTLQPTRYGVPALAAGPGLRPLWAGCSRRHASAGG